MDGVGRDFQNPPHSFISLSPTTPTTMQQDRHFTNAALLTRRHAAVARGVGQAHDLFIQKARNAELWDVEGRRFTKKPALARDTSQPCATRRS